MRQEQFDVVVVGGGGAGCSAAITAAEEGARVALVSKEPVGYGNTRIAGGWMISLGSSADSPRKLREDILRCGRFINNEEMVDTFASEVVAGTAFLESLGQVFLRDRRGRLLFFPQRGAEHSAPRALKSEARGISFGHSLRSGVAGANVAVYEEVVATRVVAESGHVQGVVCLDLSNSEVLALRSKAVILATGGAGQLFYPHTHNSRSITGDGYALALSCGAELINMEQVQWRSFSLTHPRCYEGLGGGVAASWGRLLNGQGEVFVEDISRRNTAQVSRAIGEQIRAGKTTPFGGVSLDFSLVGEEQRRLSRKYTTGNEVIRHVYGNDAYNFRTPWDVAPTEMYYLGGVQVNKDGQATVGGLYAVGECSSGLHGGARLTDIALAELFVFGPRVGQRAAAWSLRDRARRNEEDFLQQASLDEKTIRGLYGSRGSAAPIRLKRSLQEGLWRNAGLFRDEQGLNNALALISGLESRLTDIEVSDNTIYNTEVLDAIETGLMLQVAKALVYSAQERKESRGFHWRTDYPEEGDSLYNVVVSQEKGQMRVRREPIGHPRQVKGK